MSRGSATVRVLGVALIVLSTLAPVLTTSLAAPANFGAHSLTSGFGRGRLDLSGIVSEGAGEIALPKEPLALTVRVSGAGLIRFQGDGVEQTLVGSAVPTDVRMDLPRGGAVSITSGSRIRLHELVLERANRAGAAAGALGLLGLLAVAAAVRGPRLAWVSGGLVVVAFAALSKGTLSQTFAGILAARLLPLLFIVVLLIPLALALRQARFAGGLRASRLTLIAFSASLALTAIQLLLFEQPLPLGDPEAYLKMGDRFAAAFSTLRSPLDLGPALSEVQAYLALPATGLLYGFLRWFGGGLWLIYAAQALAMAVAVGALVSISETEISPRAGKLALGLALAHPSVSILPGIVQPEPFILALWTLAALAAVRALGHSNDPRSLLSAGLLFGLGLSLHPQGLSFLLLALLLCLLPWAKALCRRPMVLIAPFLGMCSVLLPVSAAEKFAEPRNYVLDQEFGFFAFTSPHPLGFWMYVDSDGWQGPLRVDDTSYQKELMALKDEGAVSSTFFDVALFVARHPDQSARTVLTNLHRLWHQPDNPFAVPFVLPYSLQISLHRALVVLFVLSLPALLSGRLALLVLPFAMLSMTYPAYHVFNKYATPALAFTFIGAAYALDRLGREASRLRPGIAALGCAAIGALLPATFFARLGVPGDAFLSGVRGLLWIGLGVALAAVVRAWGTDLRAKVLSGAVGFLVLIASSWVAAGTDTERGAWSAALAQPLEITCRVPDERGAGGTTSSRDPAWLLIDAASSTGDPPRIEVNGQALNSPTPMMPPYGLATFRGHRDPATFRQMWRAPIAEELLTSGELRIRLSGGARTRVFGDIRAGGEGPRLSLGEWPHLSVYRLMHEGQYRLPVEQAPPQACFAQGLSGRPGVALVRIPSGEEGEVERPTTSPPVWIF